MKKYLFNLRLFAEDPAAAPAAAPPDAGASETTDPTPAGQQEPDPKQKPELKYGDKDVDQIIDRKFAEWQRKQQKAVDEAAKLAGMSAQQKAEHERDQLQKQLDEYKRKDTIAEMTKTARKMLSDGGVSAPDELLVMLVSEDAEATKTAVDGFSKAFQDAVDKAVKERLKGDLPRRGSGGIQSLTKEQILAVKNPRERQKLMNDHQELFLSK